MNNFPKGKGSVFTRKGIIMIYGINVCKVLDEMFRRDTRCTSAMAEQLEVTLDADAHPSLVQEYGSRGFPTIKVFASGKPPVDYQGARDVKSIAEFAL